MNISEYLSHQMKIMGQRRKYEGMYKKTPIPSYLDLKNRDDNLKQLRYEINGSFSGSSFSIEAISK